MNKFDITLLDLSGKYLRSYSTNILPNIGDDLMLDENTMVNVVGRILSTDYLNNNVILNVK